MIISIVAAMGENCVIGNGREMPWGRKPVDGKRFFNLTVEKPIIMGRKTFETIGKPLPMRTNIVLTRDARFTAPGCIVAHSKREALFGAATAPETRKDMRQAPEVMIIGGAEIYALFLPMAHRMYLTFVFGSFEGDIFFPLTTPDKWSEWYCTNQEHEEAGMKSQFRVTFKTFARISNVVTEAN